MHRSSYRMMSEFRKYIKPRSRVLDFGGQDLNGSYRPLFHDCSYTTLDYQGADIIVKGYDWSIADETFDAVISGQTFEHDKFFWVTMKNIARVLVPGGVACIIVPSQLYHIHRHPVDVYRFMPDSMQALADWSGLNLITNKWYEKEAWGDVGGVFQKPKRKVIDTSA